MLPSAIKLTRGQGIRGGGSSLAIAHSFVFRTHPAPDTVVYYELAILPRALPSTEEAAERATNLFMAFQEFGRKAPAKLGMGWHVTPEPDGKGGFGTKVEVLGQWMGSEAEYEVVIKEFEDLIQSKEVGDFKRGQRSLSEQRRGPLSPSTGRVPPQLTSTQRICNPCTTLGATGRHYLNAVH